VVKLRLGFYNFRIPFGLVDLVTATENNSPNLYIGVDIGGTFTDFVIYDPKTGKISTSKRLSTPANPAQAVLEGLKDLLEINSRGEELNFPHYIITHGSTVATNALLEKKGSRTGLVTTKERIPYRPGNY
jgi:N-methylhydantoinase A/oxoprolinase/acetone carboxylase beta subunit